MFSLAAVIPIVWLLVKNMKLSLGLDLVSVLPLSVPEKLICLLWTKMNNAGRLREIVWEQSKMDPVDIWHRAGHPPYLQQVWSFLLLFLQHPGFSSLRSPVDVFQAEWVLFQLNEY